MAGSLPLIILFKKRIKFNIEFIVFLTSSISATLIFSITSHYKVNDLIIFNSYQVFSIICLTIFYSKIISFNILKKIIIVLGIICLFVLIYELSETSYIEYSLTFENICFFLFSIFFLIDYLIKEGQNTDLSKCYLLVNTSIFIYNAFSYLLFFYINELMQKDLWFVHNILEGLSKLLIAYAFWKLPRTSIS